MRPGPDLAVWLRTWDTGHVAHGLGWGMVRAWASFAGVTKVSYSICVRHGLKSSCAFPCGCRRFLAEESPGRHKVLRGFEPRSLDSESRVLTVTP